MSSENVELVRRSFEAFARGDFDTAFAAHDPEQTEWRTAADEPDPATWQGVEGLREFAGTLGELWENRFDGGQVFEDFIEVGDWVICPWRADLRGKGSGVQVHVDETYAVLVAGGQIVRVEEYRSAGEAVDAVRRR